MMTAERAQKAVVKGIVCPRCGCQDFYVDRTRSKLVVGAIVRWRECRHCGHVFRTREVSTE